MEDSDLEVSGDQESGRESPEAGEREKRIRKGQIARAAAREREKSVSLVSTYMPAKVNPVGSKEGGTREVRRNSIGKIQPQKQVSDQAAGKQVLDQAANRKIPGRRDSLGRAAKVNQVPSLVLAGRKKRKLSTDQDPSKAGKIMPLP